MAILQGTKRVWKDNSEFKGKADAEVVQQEIDAIASQDPDGKCKNEALVEYARTHTNSESYKLFDWNDTTAAAKYRLHQASRIKCEIMTILEEKNPKASSTQAPIVIKTATNHALPTPGAGHKNIEIILQSQEDTAALDREMFRAIEMFANTMERRFCLAPSYANVVPAIRNLLLSVPASMGVVEKITDKEPS